MQFEDKLDLFNKASKGPYLVIFDYKDMRRVVEPYSYKEIDESEPLLNGYQVGLVISNKILPKEKGHIQSFMISKIGKLEVTDISFEPRWELKITLIYKCSACGVSGVSSDDKNCPNCKKRFV